MKTFLTTLFLSLFAGACSLPTIRALPADPQASNPTVAAEAPGWSSGPRAEPRTQPQLFARDGSIVGAQEPGTIATTPNTGRTASEGEGSRWTLLEQYQNAVQAREEFELEVQGLSAALDQAESREAQLNSDLEKARAQIAQYEGRVENLEGENVDLAARLTTAQIRRLQAEKLLLEAKLDWRRIQETMTPPSDSTPATEPAPGSPPTRAGQNPTSTGKTP
jgi:hypothetical protein